MEITRELLQKILDLNDFTWIPVKRYQYEPGDGAGPFQQDFWRLLEHHKNETAFLLQVIQDLAKYALERTEPRTVGIEYFGSIKYPLHDSAYKQCTCATPKIKRSGGCSGCKVCETCNVFLGCDARGYDWPLATLKDGTVINKELNDRLKQDGIV
jgi:hypothetical protein